MRISRVAVAGAAALALCACSTTEEQPTAAEVGQFSGRIVQVVEMPGFDAGALLQQEFGRGTTLSTSSLSVSSSAMNRGYTVYRIRVDDRTVSAVATQDDEYHVNECVLVAHRRRDPKLQFAVGEADLKKLRECPEGI